MVVGLSLATPLMAKSAKAAPEISRIMIGTTAIDVPIPQGFCLARTEKERAAEQLSAAADDRNVTHLTATRCDEQSTKMGDGEYFILKTPRDALLVTIDRKTAVAELAKAAGDPAMNFQESVNQAEDGFNKVTGAGVRLSGPIGFKGSDDLCVYLGGTLELTSQTGKGYTKAMVLCMTTVDNKLISVNWYAPDTGETAFSKMRNQVRALVVAMSGNRRQ